MTSETTSLNPMTWVCPQRLQSSQERKAEPTSNPARITRWIVSVQLCRDSGKCKMCSLKSGYNDLTEVNKRYLQPLKAWHLFNCLLLAIGTLVLWHLKPKRWMENVVLKPRSVEGSDDSYHLSKPTSSASLHIMDDVQNLGLRQRFSSNTKGGQKVL